MAADAERRAELIAAAEKKLQSVLEDGIVSDLVEVEKSSLRNPSVVEAWNHLPVKFWKSQTVTDAFSIVLQQPVPGISAATYQEVLSTLMNQTNDSKDFYCFLLGGMVRDILTGQVGNDIDFNYTCSAQDIARVCVENAWPLRFYSVASDVPNKVVIGDAFTDFYLEGFSITFDAVKECYNQDFRRNLLYYDLTNHVIIDKSGYSVNDIRTNQLRFSSAPSTDFDQWAGKDGHRADKMLRWAKFLVRAEMKKKPLNVNEDERAFVIKTMTKDLRGENTTALNSFWPYALKEFMRSEQHLQALHKWVCEQNGASWWDDWLPFVKKHVKEESWLQTLGTNGSAPATGSIADDLKTMLETSGLTSKGLMNESDLKFLFAKVGLEINDEHSEVLFASARSASSPGKLHYADFIDNLITNGVI